MKPTPAIYRVLRFRLRSILVVIAFLGLFFAVILQTVRLQRAAARAANLEAEVLQARMLAEARLQMAVTAVDQFYTRLAEPPAAMGTMSAQLRRTSLEQALKYCEDMASKAPTPEARTKSLERVRQIRSNLARDADGGKP
jgi:hypothetical protein